MKASGDNVDLTQCRSVTWVHASGLGMNIDAQVGFLCDDGAGFSSDGVIKLLSYDKTNS